MTTTLAQALTVGTPDALNTSLLAALAAAGADAAGFSPFSVSAQLPAQIANARATEQNIRATLVQAVLGDYAGNIPAAWVTRTAKAWFGVDRIPATKARFLWPVTSAAGTITKPSRQAIADGSSCLFENVTPINVTAGTAQLVEFEARTAGTVGNVSPGSVVGFQVGASGLGITSPAGSLIAAGRPEESNVELFARGRARFPSTSLAGNSAAFDYWIPTAATTITRWAVDDSNPNGPGSTDVFAANAAGPATVGELAALDAYLQPLRGKGTGPLRVLAAPALTLSPGVIIRATSTAGVAAAAAGVFSSLSASVPLGGGVGGVLFLDSIRKPLLAIATVYELLFSGIDEETALPGYNVLTLTPSIVVTP